MALINFCKYHGLGNSYLIAEASDSSVQKALAYLGATETPGRGFQDITKRLCCENFGVGSDGMLFITDTLLATSSLPHMPVEPTADAGKSPPLCVLIINPDGGEAEKSGNGLRIAVLHLFRRGIVKESQPFVLHTKGGDVTAIVNSADFIEDGSSRSHCVRAEVTVDMGVIRKDGGSGSEEGVTLLCDTLRESLRFEALSIGNPHAVARARDSLSLEDLANAVKEVGARVESSRPGGTNVQIFSVGKTVDGKRCLRAAIWERGAGYTLASGSSSCAVGAAAALLHRCIDSENVEVHMQGGLLRVSVTAASNSSASAHGGLGSVRIQGPAEFICEGKAFLV